MTLLLATPGQGTTINTGIVAAGGGGENDAQAVCDPVPLTCAAAAAVSLAGCATAHVDADASASGVLAVFPAVVSAHAEADITVCMTVASAQAATGGNLLPVMMENYAIAARSYSGGEYYSWAWQDIDNDNACFNGLGQVTFPCGPTGKTYQSDKAECAAAAARASSMLGAASFQEVRQVSGMVASTGIAGASIGLPASSSATAHAKSSECVNTDEATALASRALSRVKFERQALSVSEALTSVLEDAADAQVEQALNGARGGVRVGDTAMLDALLDAIGSQLKSDLHKAIEHQVDQQLND